MPNPFDLRGPEFLVFYIILGMLVTVGVVVLRRASEPFVVTPAGSLTDYLKIAYLRGGAEEALRVATLALIDRGLVELVGEDTLHAVPANAPGRLQRTEERLLENCKVPTKASELLSDESLRVTVSVECEPSLMQAGLLPDDRVKASRLWLLFVAMLFLGFVAFLKILVALGRGRTNIEFLIVACVIFGVVVYRVANPFRTAAGEAMLADLRMLFSALRERSRSIYSPPGGNEIVLLAAVFGTRSLPGRFEYIDKLFRKPDRERSSSSCGSSCGSGGSSCGGGCGGGGCGGCGG
jgi:uncharacterized protein (TIGR04222 family)